MGRYKPVEASQYTEETAVNKGFYYDSQLNDPMMSVSLHPNTMLGGKDKHEDGWGPFDDGLFLEATTKETKGEEYWDKYSKTPIARAIMTEDFAYSVANNFTDYNGGNPIEQMFDTVKPYASILGTAAEGFKKGANMNKEDNMGSWLVNKVGSLAETIAPWMNKASNMLNNALIVQGTRFTYYSGTSFNFNNMELKFIAFSDWINGGTEFQPVSDYIKELKPYVMGTYHPVCTNLFPEADQFIKEYVGYQSPPGGFYMSTKHLDHILRGTMRLNIGGKYAISNLIIKNMNVTMSKAQAKDPRPGKEGETVPLYAEITLQLQPASSIVDTSYDTILGHKGIETDVMKPVADSYKSKLNTLKDTLYKEINASF